MLMMLALAVAAATSGGETPPDPHKTLLSAVDMVNNGKLDKAMPLLDRVLAQYQEQHPTEKRPLYCAADISIYPMAITQEGAQQAGGVLVNADWCSALYHRGYILNDRKQFQEAVTALERVAAMAPYSAHYLNELGFSYQQLGQIERSMETYKRAEMAAKFTNEGRGTADEARALRGQGYEFIELGKLDDAEAAYRRSIEIDPDNATAKHELDYIAEQRRNRT